MPHIPLVSRPEHVKLVVRVVHRAALDIDELVVVSLLDGADGPSLSLIASFAGAAVPEIVDELKRLSCHATARLRAI